MTVMKKSDTCIVWQTHRLDDGALEEYARLENECRGFFDTAVLYDNSKSDFVQPASYPDTRFALFDINELKQNYRLSQLSDSLGVTPGNTIFPLLDFAQSHSYAYYWLIEYDVRYTGNWREFFFYFSQSKSDLLGTTLYRHAFRPSWCWWSSLKTPRLSLVRRKNWIRGLFPVMRVSDRALQIFKRGNRQGWRGHYEVCLPTLLYHRGLLIEDIGGDGEFVMGENVNRFYTNSPQVDGLGPGTFVCPPTQPITERLPNKLYHAVK